MRCGHESKRKNGLRRHLTRKFICLPVLNDIDNNYMLILLENGDYLHFQKEIYNFICKYCNKNFSTSFSLMWDFFSTPL